MDYEFSLAHLTVLQSTPQEMVRIAAKTGYQYVSQRMTAVTPNERIYPLIDDRAMMKATKASSRVWNISVTSVSQILAQLLARRADRAAAGLPGRRREDGTAAPGRIAGSATTAPALPMDRETCGPAPGSCHPGPRPRSRPAR